MTQLEEINPSSTDCKADTLTTMPLRRCTNCEGKQNCSSVVFYRFRDVNFVFICTIHTFVLSRLFRYLSQFLQPFGPEKKRVKCTATK